jgi:hypothetical protein
MELEHPLTLDESKAIGDKSQVGQASVASRIQAGYMVVRVNGSMSTRESP